jgi:hypothetical protein
MKKHTREQRSQMPQTQQRRNQPERQKQADNYLMLAAMMQVSSRLG